MEFSKLKLELYDLAAIVLPGIFFIAEIWATLLGIGSLASAAKELTGAQLTILLLCGFGAGNVIQEGGNRLVTLFLGKTILQTRARSLLELARRGTGSSEDEG